MYTSGLSNAICGLVGCCVSFMIINFETFNRFIKEINIFMVYGISIMLLTNAGTENKETLEGNK